MGRTTTRRAQRARSEHSLPWIFAWSVACAVVMGGAVELLQTLTAREASFDDLRLDVMGALLGAACLGRGATRTAEWMRGAIAMSVALALLTVDVWPLVRALVDERDARRQFPVLADFSSPFEQDRWAVNGSMRVANVVGAESARELQMELQPAQYSGFGLTQFPGDWRGYSALVMTVGIEQAPDLPLTCRIHDRAHDTNNRFDDRFNGRFPLVAGLQEIRIGLDEVERAPATRKLDLSTVAGFGCFFVGLDQPLGLVIQRVELVRGP